MSISDKVNLLIRRYVRREVPTLNSNSIVLYLSDQLKEIEASTRSLGDASIQVAEAAPESPRRGMVRYAISPWNPLSNGFSGLVVYTGSAWAQISGSAQTAAQIKTLLEGVTYAQLS